MHSRFFFHAHSAVIRIGETGIYHRDDIHSAVWLAGYGLCDMYMRNIDIVDRVGCEAGDVGYKIYVGI